jgi:RNA polymerase sporulation-specific sigma factor
VFFIFSLISLTLKSNTGVQILGGYTVSNDFRKLVIRAREDEATMVYIIECFENLMKKCIKLYLWDNSYFDDAMQNGRIAMMSCVRNYDVNSPAPFEAYAEKAVIYATRNFACRIKKYTSFDEKLGEEEEPLRDILESDVDLERDFIKKEEIKELGGAIRKLPERHRELVMDYYFKRINMRKMSEEKNCHYMTVVQAKEQALGRLRNQMRLGGELYE